jgi:lambda family phage tail tape measure protein
MADLKAQIEIKADATGVEAGVSKAKRSLADLGATATKTGDQTAAATARASRSVDAYVTRLQTQAAIQGRSAREAELYKLSLKGASSAQLAAADSALRLAEGYERGAIIGARLRAVSIGIAAAATAAAAALSVGTVALIRQVGDYQDLAEKIGDTAVNVSSLKTAADVSGTAFETIASNSVKLTAALSKTDDESKLVGESIKALGLDFQAFKLQSPIEQLQSVARAFAQFADGSEKTAVAVGIFGKQGAELLGFLKEYAGQGLAAAYITNAQTKAADDFADASARLKSELQQFLQVSAVGLVPVLNDMGDLFGEMASREQTASVAASLMSSTVGGLVNVFQAVSVLGTDVAFVLKGVGTEIGAIAAQIAALGRLDFKGFSAISDAVKEDGARARAELDRLQARILAIGQPSATGTGFGSRAAEDRGFTPGLPTLDISGLSRDKAAKGGASRGRRGTQAAEEAKNARAQLAFEIDAIRNTRDTIANALSNAERILDAQRAAALVDDADYFERKRALLDANAAAEVESLTAQKARLQLEKLTGDDAIANTRKIADVESTLAKVRADAATNVEVLSIQQVAANKRITDSLIDARAAAQAYFDTIANANARDLSGLGRGARQREIDARINERGDQFQARRDELSNQLQTGQITAQDYARFLEIEEAAHARALANDAKYWRDKLALQADWSLGAEEALTNYTDAARDTYAQIDQVTTRAFAGMEDALVSFVTTGRLSFKSLADSIAADITRIAIRQQVLAPLADLLKGAGGSGGTAWLSSLFGGGSSSSPASTAFDSWQFHSGGIVGEGGSRRAVPASVFAGARRFHGGGLASGEVPAILMGGPRGRREEVLTASDPRHADNGGRASGVSIVNHFSISGPTDRRTETQIAAAAYRGLQRGMRNL